jgi:hypothetical protein
MIWITVALAMALLSALARAARILAPLAWIGLAALLFSRLQ